MLNMLARVGRGQLIPKIESALNSVCCNITGFPTSTKTSHLYLLAGNALPDVRKTTASRKKRRADHRSKSPLEPYQHNLGWSQDLFPIAFNSLHRVSMSQIFNYRKKMFANLTSRHKMGISPLESWWKTCILVKVENINSSAIRSYLLQNKQSWGESAS